MSNKKETVYVKANGLRNELKEIRKSIDKLTNVAEHIIDIWAATQTHKQYEYHETSTGGPYRIHTVHHHDTTDGMRRTTYNEEGTENS